MLPAGLATGQAPRPAGAALTPPLHLTAEQAHQRMMDLLHITSLRPGADPDHPQASNAVNYEEAKANPYSNLPDPLLLTQLPHSKVSFSAFCGLRLVLSTSAS